MIQWWRWASRIFKKFRKFRLGNGSDTYWLIDLAMVTFPHLTLITTVLVTSEHSEASIGREQTAMNLIKTFILEGKTAINLSTMTATAFSVRLQMEKPMRIFSVRRARDLVSLSLETQLVPTSPFPRSIWTQAWSKREPITISFIVWLTNLIYHRSQPIQAIAKQTISPTQSINLFVNGICATIMISRILVWTVGSPEIPGTTSKHWRETIKMTILYSCSCN